MYISGNQQQASRSKTTSLGRAIVAQADSVGAEGCTVQIAARAAVLSDVIDVIDVMQGVLAHTMRQIRVQIAAKRWAQAWRIRALPRAMRAAAGDHQNCRVSL